MLPGATKEFRTKELPVGYKTTKLYEKPPPNVYVYGPPDFILPPGHNWMYQAVKNYGWHYWYKVPKNREVVNTSHLQRWKNDSQNFNDFIKGLSKNQFSRKNSDTKSTYIATGMAAGPALPATTVASVNPVLTIAQLMDCGLINHETFDPEKFCKSFPCDTKLRNCVTRAHAECIVEMKHDFKGKKIHMAHDKGNKRGLDHLAKAASLFNRKTGKIDTKVVDINTSGSCGEGVADGLQNSLGSVGCPTFFKLASCCTDNGGGGVLEESATKLKERGLTLPRFIVSNCCVHTHQISLSHGIQTYFGSGSINKKNVMQMMHSAYDLQSHLGPDEFQHFAKLAKEWVFDQLGDNPTPEEGHF